MKLWSPSKCLQDIYSVFNVLDELVSLILSSFFTFYCHVTMIIPQVWQKTVASWSQQFSGILLVLPEASESLAVWFARKWYPFFPNNAVKLLNGRSPKSTSRSKTNCNRCTVMPVLSIDKLTQKISYEGSSLEIIWLNRRSVWSMSIGHDIPTYLNHTASVSEVLSWTDLVLPAITGRNGRSQIGDRFPRRCTIWYQSWLLEQLLFMNVHVIGRDQVYLKEEFNSEFLEFEPNQM